MILILGSYADIASTNIFKHIISVADFKNISENLYIHKSLYLRMIDSPLIYAENIDEKIRNVDKIDFDEIVFISRHKSESGRVSLTVHPIGNFGEARYGGREKTLCPSSPITMVALLRTLYKYYPDITSYEVTHHGPYVNTKSTFIEIGSDENSWRRKEFAEVIAEAILKLLDDGIKEFDIYVGIGGGHYAPRFTEISIKENVAFGHMVSKYYVPYLTQNLLREAIEKTPGCMGICVHKKSIRSDARKRIAEMAENMKTEVIMR